MRTRALTLLALAVLGVATFKVGEAYAFGFKQRYGTPTEAPGSGDGEFSSPFGMAEDIAGFTYMSDVGNHRIQKFAPDGTFVAWAGRCTGGVNCDTVNQRSMGFSCTAATCSGGGPGSNPGQFDGPHGIAIKFGKLYVADRQNHRIQVLDLITGILEFPPFGTLGDGDGQFEAPYDVAVDGTGKIYVTDSGNDRIQVLVENHPPTPNPPFLSFFAEFGSFGTSDGQFRNPHGIAVDSADNVYVADRGNNRIQKFNPTGTFLAKFGTAGTAEGEFDEPTDVIVHSSGNISVADYANNRIQEFDSSRTFLRTFGIGVLDGTEVFQICTEACQAGVTSTLESAVNKPLQVAEGSTKASTETCTVQSQAGGIILGSGCGVDFDDDGETCGDGMQDVGEFCDKGSANGTTSCCSTSCLVQLSDTTCRAAAGTCDAAETCNGISASCPSDSFKSASTQCRAAVGTCDVAESCTGSSADCPDDSFADAETECRASAGLCDVAETCTGSSASCPTDSFASAATVCRSSSGICDLAESCTGSSASCPTDTFASAGTSCGGSDADCDALDTCDGSGSCIDNVDPAATVCRTASGVCDVAESCDGSSKTCPADGFVSAATVCRGASGSCDVAESCTGSSALCPTDTFASAGTSCGGSDADCDALDTCDGSGSCIDNVDPATTECRSATGTCDVAESCDGTTKICPVNSFASAGTSCGGSDADCDALDTCDGSGTCVDRVDPATTECRTATGGCDVVESCDGTTKTCPVDVAAPSGTTCRAAAGECDVAETCDGSSTTCPVDGFVAAAATCRAAAGDCDIAEACTGSSAECPTDAKSTAVCRAANGECDVAESCNGTDTDCPADGFASTDTLCRAGDDECDAAEYCTGTGAVCPTDLAAADGTLCADTDGEDCTLAACQEGQCSQGYDTCLGTCRSPLFWGWHAGTEKHGTNITLAVLQSTTAARLTVCGETLDDTDKNSASSAVEALCLPTPKEGEISQLQLAKQLAAAKLNCVANGEEPECLSLISACDTICQTPGASTASLAACIQDLELLNGGLSLYAPECEQGVLLGGVSASPAGSTKKCYDANKTDCTITGTGETACKAGTNTPD